MKGAINLAFWFLVATGVMLASMVLAFKAALPLVDKYRPQIEKNLSQLTGMEVVVGGIRAELNGLNIELYANDIAINTPEKEGAVRVRSLDFELDIVGSVVNISPQFQNVVVSGVDVLLQENGSGQIALRGGGTHREGKTSSGDTDIVASRILNYLSDQRQLVLADLNVELQSLRFNTLNFSIPATYLVNRRDRVQLSTDVFVNHQDEPIQIRSQISADLTNFFHRQISAYIQLPQLDVPLEWVDSSYLSQLTKLTIGGQYWITYQPNKSLSVQAQEGTVKLAFVDEQMLDVKGDWRLKQSSNGLIVSTKNMSLANDNASVEDLRLKGEWEYGSGRGFFVFNNMDATVASDTALQFVPTDWYLSRLLRNLEIQGNATNASLRLWHSNGHLKYQYLSNIIDAKVEGYNGIPAVNHIDGVFSLSDTQGRIEFVTQDAQLSFPTVFERFWDIDYAAGEINWRKLDQAFIVSGRDLYIERNVSTIQGGFRLEQPNEKGVGEPWLSLDVNAQHVPTSDRFTFVPDKALPDSLRDWLDASLGSGEARNVDLLLRTGLAKGDQPYIRLAIDAQLDQFAFSEDWPLARDIDGKVLVKNDGVSVNVKNAMFVGLPVEGLSVDVPLDEGAAKWVQIKGQLSGESNEILTALNKTPLEESVLQPFKDWQVAGPVSGSFDVSVPIAGQSLPPKVNLNADFSNNSIFISQLNLPVNIGQGTLRYSPERGLSGSHFDVSALGGESRIRLSSSRNDMGDIVIAGDINGVVDSKTLIDWRSWPDVLKENISGQATYKAKLAINKSQIGQVDVDINSNLQGVMADFPQPLQKLQEDSQFVNVRLKAFQDELLLDLSAKQLVYAKILFNSGVIQGGDVSVFKPLVPSDVMNKGVSFKGQLAELDWHDWQGFFEQNVENVGTSADIESVQPVLPKLPEWVRSMEFLVDRAPINAQNQLNNIKLTYDRTKDGHPLMVTSDELNAVLRLTSENHPELHIAYLNWLTAKAATNTDAGAEQQDAKDSFNPNIIPSMTLSIDEVYVDNRPYGDWKANVVNLGHDLRISNIRTRLEHGNFKGEIFWRNSEQPRVDVTIKAKGKDAQELTRKFSSTPFIKSDSYDIDVNLSWNDSLLNFSRRLLSGRIDFEIEDGNFNQVDQLPPFLRVLGIFNVDALVKRLTFDFSDIYEPGMPFDTFSSTLEIKKGMLKTVRPVKVISPTAEITLKGTANLVDETLKERLTATIPITSSLPVAGLLLGTPQIAGILYITDKLIGDQISKVTSIQYEIEGSFSEPKVTPVPYRPL